MSEKQIKTCNWWGYITLRVAFRRRCADRYAQYIEKYKNTKRFLYCPNHRAVLTRYGNVWEKHQPVYVSSFCDIIKCTFKDTCANCKYNLNRQR